MTPFFLFFGLMVATGFIAHWSDNLGKKLGKKRVSLFGLRPKQTATLITIASSLLIMTVTFAAMLGVYKPLRDALLRYDKERDANRQLEIQVQSQRAELTRVQTQQNRSKQRLAEVNETLGTTNTKLSTAQSNLRIASAAEKNARAGEAAAKRGQAAAKRAQFAAKRGENTARQNENAARQREQSARQNEAKAQRGESEALRNQADAQRKYQFAKRELKDAEKNLSDARQQLKPLRAQLKAAEVAVSVAQKDVVAAQDKLFKQGGELIKGEQELASSRAQLEQQKTLLAQLQSDVAQRQKDVAQLVDKYQNFKDRLTNAANKILADPILVASRETLAVKTIPARLDEATVQNLLRDLVRTARANVKKLGEENGRLGLNLTVVPRQVELDNGVYEADEAAQLTILAKSLGGAMPSSVRVIATRTHSVDEPDINAGFEVVPIRTAYRRNDIIASAIIDGSRSDGKRNAAKIFNQLLALVNEGQRLAEREHQVEPPLGRDTQFYAVDTNERIFDAINDIQALNAPARVLMRAAEDLSTAAPLRVRFEVLPSTNSGT